MEGITIPCLDYCIQIENGLLARSGTILRSLFPSCHMFIVTDSNVAPIYLQIVCDALTSAGFRVSSFVIPAGEASKSMEMLEKVLDCFCESGLTRRDCAVALGGGVVGDLTGFASGCFCRGIPFVQMPTTLLAAIDSSVGGKTAVNLNAGKNLAGLFYNPVAVLCDPSCLQTLPHSVFIEGMAEMVKIAILSDNELLYATTNCMIMEQLPALIARSVQHKVDIVTNDMHEQGSRKLLNLGHTIGHAIEKASNFTVSHGFAVSIGIAYVTRAMNKRQLLSDLNATQILETLQQIGLPISCKYTPETLYTFALHDKKFANERITVILPDLIDHCRMEEIPLSGLLDLIRDGAKDE